MNQIKLFAIAVASTLLCACNNNTGATNTPTTVAAPTNKTQLFANTQSSSSIYSVGGTYDTMSSNPTATTTCFRDGGDPTKWRIVNPKANLDFSQSQSLQTIERALGVDYSETINAGPFSASIAFNYGYASQDTNYSLNINYVYQYAGTAMFKDNALIQGESVLTPDAQAFLHSSPTDFRRMCGDGFVASLDAGSSVLFHLTLKFDSNIEKNAYSDSFDKIGGLDSVLSKIMTNPGGIHYSLSASGLQLGGDPTLLNQIFIQNGGKVGADGYPTLDCGTGSNNNSCVNLISQLMTYVQKIPDELRSVTDYNLINPVVSNWSSIGIDPGHTEINPQTLTAMQQLTLQYYADASSLTLLKNYQNMLINKNVNTVDMLQELSKNVQDYTDLMNMYRDPQIHFADCFNGFVSTSCLSIHDKAFDSRQKILSTSTDISKYINNNQYTIELPVTKDRTKKCGLSPVTSESSGLYLVNCDGQVSANLNPDAGLRVTHTSNDGLLISNLHYVFTDKDSGVNTFNVRSDNPFLVDAIDNYSYFGSFPVDAVFNEVPMQFMSSIWVWHNH